MPIPLEPSASTPRWEILRAEYIARRPQYERLGANLKHAIKDFLEERDIHFLGVTARIKSFESASEKIARKRYDDPFREIEDWCGLRVVCFYRSDIETIRKIIRDELDVVDEIDTASRLAVDQFGYQSVHFIVRPPEDWVAAPNYRGLRDLKAEIQIRTVLMHAWAEIEHKLAYKSSEQVPDRSRRVLSRLAGDVESIDERFEELRDNLATYRERLKQGDTFSSTAQLDLDALRAFLDLYFGDRAQRLDEMKLLLEEMRSAGVTMQDMASGYEQVRAVLPEVEAGDKQLFNEDENWKWSQVGAGRTILDLTHDGFYGMRKPEFESGAGDPWSGRTMEWRRTLGRAP